MDGLAKTLHKEIFMRFVSYVHQLFISSLNFIFFSYALNRINGAL